jgi:hypothetical protein
MVSERDLILVRPALQGLSLLLPSLNSPEAIQMLLAIGWQESRFQHRAQTRGPARGFWQFEKGGGVVGVLRHRKTKQTIRDVLLALLYPSNMDEGQAYVAIEHNDVLAAAFARLLLFTHPRKLPALMDADEGWKQYLETWRPGKPHPTTWAKAWKWATEVRKSLDDERA